MAPQPSRTQSGGWEEAVGAGEEKLARGEVLGEGWDGFLWIPQGRGCGPRRLVSGFAAIVLDWESAKETFPCILGLGAMPSSSHRALSETRTGVPAFLSYTRESAGWGAAYCDPLCMCAPPRVAAPWSLLPVLALGLPPLRLLLVHLWLVFCT